MTPINSGFNREVFDSQMTVFQIGDSGESAFVIESGCVEVLVGTGGDMRRVAVLAEGAMFGEVALLDRQPRTATVRALVPTVLVRIDRTHVEELLQRSDPVIQYLLRILLERFRSQQTGPSSQNPEDVQTPQVPPQVSAGLDLHAAAVRTLSLAHDLSDAIDGNQLTLYYQPIIRLSDTSLAGYESLVRWQHPTLGIVSPDEFIPLAEKTGLIHRIGQWVLNRACRDWQALRGHCVQFEDAHPFVSVNLSAPELCSPNIVKSIEECLAKNNMPAHELRIELTETIVISSLEAVSNALEKLRALEVGIALDDFGTGYAGLDYLQSLPFSSIKIDKTFVQQMHTSQRSFQIIKAALELSNPLGLSTVAEGIEDDTTATALAALGCTYGQGYFFGRPMPLTNIAQWVAAQD
jgi:EAL domain-containing protein (putative c-di-GMP-specific phosphodiesterase class I)/CRP-like cAMP-binding protein